MRIRNQAGRLALGLVLALVAVGPAFAKHTHEVDLGQAVTINGKQLIPGKYKVTWETHSPQATITFTHKKDVVATTTGVVVDRPKAYDNDSILYSSEPDGTVTILELRFAGSNKVLTFDATSSSGA